MERHDFEPARLITGLTALGVGAAYGLEALGEIDPPGTSPLLAIPVGLFLAGLAAAIRGAVRRRAHNAEPPPGRWPHTDDHR